MSLMAVVPWHVSKSTRKLASPRKRSLKKAPQLNNTSPVTSKQRIQAHCCPTRSRKSMPCCLQDNLSFCVCPSLLMLTAERNKDLIAALNSPSLRHLFRNLL